MVGQGPAVLAAGAGQVGCFFFFFVFFFSSPEPKAHKVSLSDGTRAGVRASVRPCVRHTFKHEYLRDQQADYNQILSEASLGWGKGCIRF